jgi:RHS repeat-associated protein
MCRTTNPSGAGAFDLPLRFPGQYFDRETNLAYNYHRDYDSGTGRYMQSDPVGPDAGVNTYAYGVGNPTLYIDPDGLDIKCPDIFDIGPYDLQIHSVRCYSKGRPAYHRFQYRYEDIGILVGEFGSCDCGGVTKTCIYALLFKQWTRDTPCGGGPWSPWRFLSETLFRRPLKAVIDCKTGDWDPSKFMLGEIGPLPKTLPKK